MLQYRSGPNMGRMKLNATQLKADLGSRFLRSAWEAETRDAIIEIVTIRAVRK